MPIYLDDVNDGKFLGKITEGFDDGLVYETSEVNFYLFSITLNACFDFMYALFVFW